MDSPLEEAGFELSVPGKNNTFRECPVRPLYQLAALTIGARLAVADA
jgi:hypothetical protein